MHTPFLPSNRSRAVVILAAVGVAIGAGLVVAGPLAPPAGPIGGTYKTLNEVEPRVAINAVNTPGAFNATYMITQPGSYYLTGNITGESGKYGIIVGADGITIDLNGFTMTGVAGSASGIGHAVNSYRNVTVLNGTVTGWGGSGVGISGAGCRVAGVRAASNTGNGIGLGINGIVESCSATDNSNHGISVGHGSVVRGCVAYSNDNNGIIGGGTSVVADCNAYQNETGIFVSNGSSLTGCAARDNTVDGIVVSSAAAVSNCSAYSNGGDGIRCGGTSTTISQCTASFNTGDGIEVPGNCTLLNNTCDANTAGIRATGTDNRIDGNSLMRNDLGMDVTLTGNLIFKNTASGNTLNYQIIAGNRVGVIVEAPSSAVVSGSTGGAGVGTTNAWANFSY